MRARLRKRREGSAKHFLLGALTQPRSLVRSIMGLTPHARQEHEAMRIAHFIHRYPPAVGGSEAWFARLSRQFAAWGDDVTVFTTNALDLDAFWSRRGRCVGAGVAVEDGVTVERHALWRVPGQRWLLRGLSLVPGERWRAFTMSCNPLA